MSERKLTLTSEKAQMAVSPTCDLDTFNQEIPLLYIELCLSKISDQVIDVFLVRGFSDQVIDVFFVGEFSD